MTTQREGLESHIATIDRALATAAPSEVAALLRERRITLAEIGEKPAEGTVRDELKRKREARRGAASKAATSSS